jgi:hypothetical protein
VILGLAGHFHLQLEKEGTTRRLGREVWKKGALYERQNQGELQSKRVTFTLVQSSLHRLHRNSFLFHQETIPIPPH